MNSTHFQIYGIYSSNDHLIENLHESQYYLNDIYANYLYLPYHSIIVSQDNLQFHYFLLFYRFDL